MMYKRIYVGDQVEIFEIAPNIYFRKASLHGRGQCNGALFVNETGVSIVDAPPGALEIVDEARTLFEKPVRQIFITHAHGDHDQGLSDFYDMDVEIYCSRRTAELVMHDVKGHKAAVVGVEGMVPVMLSGGMEIELMTLPDVTHSRWDMFIRLPENGILCSGDSVVEYKNTYFHEADIAGWISSIKKLAAMPGKLILPGHGDAPLEYAYLGVFREYLEVLSRSEQECFNMITGGNIYITANDMNLSAESVCETVESFFRKRSNDAQLLEERCGVPDSRRVVRMALWNNLRHILV